MKRFVGSALLALAFRSCEKVIEVELKDSDKKYVVEAFLSDENRGTEVRVSQTVSFGSSNAFNGRSGAQVSLTSSTGSSYAFTETAPGIYKTVAFAGVPGLRYMLQVKVDGQVFTASSTMPQPVALDTAYTEAFAVGAESRLNVVPVYTDPVGKANQYRFRVWASGQEQKAVHAHNDALNDGRRVSRPLFDNESEIERGQLVQVEMQCVDGPVYTYWYSLSQQAAGPGGAATPANPVSNFSGGCLGYFSVHTVSRRSFVVQ
jgi:hypothetical protein